jgi:hypothetical protein
MCGFEFVNKLAVPPAQENIQHYAELRRIPVMEGETEELCFRQKALPGHLGDHFTGIQGYFCGHIRVAHNYEQQQKSVGGHTPDNQDQLLHIDVFGHEVANRPKKINI